MRYWAVAASVLGLSSAMGGVQEPTPATDAPLFTIVYSADIDGYLEPCGCGGINEGGIARQATLLKQLRAQGPVLAISGGGLGGIPEAVSAMVNALATMRYDYLIPSAADLEICPAVLDEAASLGIRALRRAAPSSAVAPEVVEVAGLRVAIAGVSLPPPNSRGLL
ncbi:MAG TPA: hypothetical protein PLQ54_08655 [Armatimonadota bacterium]|nr:hypothetical protein [Armatimonadota bacterium]